MATQTTYAAQVALARRLDGLSLVMDTLELEGQERQLISLIRPPRLRARFERLNAEEFRILHAGSGQLRKSNGVLDQLEHELSGKKEAPDLRSTDKGPSERSQPKDTTPSNQLPLFGEPE